MFNIFQRPSLLGVIAKHLIFTVFLMLTLSACSKHVQKLKPETALFKPSVLLLLAHPDDETMIGGYLLELERLNIPVHAIYVTSGEGGKLQVKDARGVWTAKSIDAQDLKKIREHELNLAGRAYGIDSVLLLHEQDKPLRDVNGLPIRDGHAFIQKNIWNQATVSRAIVDAVKLYQPHFIITMSLDPLNHAQHKTVRLFTDELNLKNMFNFVEGIYAFSETGWVNPDKNDEKKIPKMLLHRKALLPGRSKNYGVLSNQAAKNHQSQSTGHMDPWLHDEELYEVSGSLQKFYDLLCKEKNCKNRIAFIKSERMF